MVGRLGSEVQYERGYDGGDLAGREDGYYDGHRRRVYRARPPLRQGRVSRFYRAGFQDGYRDGYRDGYEEGKCRRLYSRRGRRR